MSIVYRQAKGSELTYIELDNNISELYTGQTTALAATGGSLDGRSVTVSSGTNYIWKDLLGDYHPPSGGGTNPSLATFIGGLQYNAFSASSMNEVWTMFHIGHDYAPGTVVYPHVHWSTTGTNTGVVRWGFEYTVAKGHQQQAFASPTTVYVEQAGTGTAYKHMIAEVALASAIPATNMEPDTLILMRVFRDAANANDTQTGTAFLFFIDCHYQAKFFGSKNKTPPFYT